MIWKSILNYFKIKTEKNKNSHNDSVPEIAQADNNSCGKCDAFIDSEKEIIGLPKSGMNLTEHLDNNSDAIEDSHDKEETASISEESTNNDALSNPSNETVQSGKQRCEELPIGEESNEQDGNVDSVYWYYATCNGRSVKKEVPKAKKETLSSQRIECLTLRINYLEADRFFWDHRAGVPYVKDHNWHGDTENINFRSFIRMMKEKGLLKKDSSYLYTVQELIEYGYTGMTMWEYTTPQIKTMRLKKDCYNTITLEVMVDGQFYDVGPLKRNKHVIWDAAENGLITQLVLYGGNFKAVYEDYYAPEKSYKMFTGYHDFHFYLEYIKPRLIKKEKQAEKKSHRPTKPRPGVAVAQIDPQTGEVIDIFESMKEASEKAHVTYKGIQAVISGEQNHAGRYGWKKLDDI